jgi:hypothetical protein
MYSYFSTSSCGINIYHILTRKKQYKFIFSLLEVFHNLSFTVRKKLIGPIFVQRITFSRRQPNVLITEILYSNPKISYPGFSNFYFASSRTNYIEQYCYGVWRVMELTGEYYIECEYHIAECGGLWSL